MGKLIWVAATVLLGGCVHEQLAYRDGCWIKTVESRRGDVREHIAACEPKAPAWSGDPLVRAVEDCLNEARQARYQTMASSPAAAAATDWDAVAARCLAEPQKLALDKVEHMQGELAAAQAQIKRMADENRELRQSMIACVEKTPNATATANASTESKSDSANSRGEHVEVVHTVSTSPAVHTGVTPVKHPAPAKPDCPQPQTVTQPQTAAQPQASKGVL